MNVNWARVIAISGALTVVATGALLWQSMKPSKPVPPTWTPWIALPATGMDASSLGLRDALFSIDEIESRGSRMGRFKSLLHDCEAGAFDPDPDLSEVYVVWHSDRFMHPEAWRVAFFVHGDRIKTTIEDARGVLYPPPPPLRPGDVSTSATGNEEPGVEPRTIWFKKSQLRTIADAWRSTRIWLAPQEDNWQCTDSALVFLEACVHGRYALRAARCGEGNEQAQQLLDTIQTTLPMPR